MPALKDLPPLFGHYRVERKLGEGGMGAVYLAHDTKLGRKVALKVPKLTTDDDIARFEREARTAAAIDHPNVCTIHEVAVRDGINYLTMPFIEGTSLADVIRPDHLPPLPQAVEWVRKLASALQALHDTGLIHRDLKPANVILKHGIEPVLMDFGLARSFSDDGQKLTSTGAVVGTPVYMSPEQANSEKEIGPATDIYSLGVILFELLTGRRPFEAPTLVILFKQILLDDPPAPSSLRPGLAPAWDAICAKALAKQPAERFTSMTAFAAALQQAASGGRQPPGNEQAGASQDSNEKDRNKKDRDEKDRDEKDRGADAPRSPEVVACPACSKKLKLLPTSWGKRVRCPGCQHAFTPNDVATLAAPMPVPPSPRPDPPTQPPPDTSTRRGVRPGTPVLSTPALITLGVLVLATGLVVGWALFGQRGAGTQLAVNPTNTRTPPTEKEPAKPEPVKKNNPPPEPEKKPDDPPPKIQPGKKSEAPPKVEPKRPQAPPQTVTNSIGMKLALIPAGTFIMGSPASEADRSDNEPPHEVEITKPFYLGVYEVTQEEYERVMGTNPSHFSASGDGKAKVAGLDTRRFPVENVSHDSAVEFCVKLNARPEEKASGRLYRLPTEAEWEYSCREGGSSKTPFSFGTSLSSTQANFDGNFPYGGAPKGRYFERPVPVDDQDYQPNKLGLYHMHGNVWEWCSDWYDQDYYRNSKREDPQGPANGTFRVLRGGSWHLYGRSCRAAYRDRGEPDDRYLHDGFRVVLVPPRTP